MATIDVANTAKVPPKAIHAGANQVAYRLSTSLTLSAGDVYRLGKLPHRAIVTEVVFFAGPALPATAVIKLGISASQELFFTSATRALAVERTAIAQGTRRVALVSFSDEAPVRYENVVAVATAGVSVGHQCDLVVSYVLDDALG